MSTSNSGHPFRMLLLITAVVAIVIAFRNAVADKGGTYDPMAN